jgi:hypothetical protein
MPFVDLVSAIAMTVFKLVPADLRNNTWYRLGSAGISKYPLYSMKPVSHEKYLDETLKPHVGLSFAKCEEHVSRTLQEDNDGAHGTRTT